MAILNLLDLQPTTISRDLRDKYILLYGPAKCGKTSFQAQIPNNLIFCFEKGVNFLPGVFAVDVPKWVEFKALLKQLEKDEIKQKFNTVTIDTVSLAYDLCTQYICSQNNVKTVGELAYGKGYALVKDEFTNALRQISMLGYGIVLITHAKVKNVKVDDDSTIEIASPNIPDRAQDVVNALVDIIGYIDISYENGTAVRTLITRGTPNIVAGSRLKYLAPRIPFGYDELINAIGDAIEKQAKIDGAKVVDKGSMQKVIETRPFTETLAEAKELWTKLVNEGKVDAVMAQVENLFGEPMKLSEIPESKQDIFEVLIEDMRAM